MSTAKIELPGSKLPNTGTSIFALISQLSAEYQAVNLGQGFPDFSGDPQLIDRVNFYMQAGKNQYAPMPGVPVLREQLAAKIKRTCQHIVDPDTEITLTCGATQALFTTITAFVHPGDEVIIFEPAYDSYRPTIELCGGQVRAIQLHGPEYRVDWNAFEKLLNSNTRMVIVNTPHNPTATVWTDEDWRTLADHLKNRQTLVLSDEVYEHLIYDGRKHHSVMHYPELWDRSIAVYSFGKTFHFTGWKMGYAVAPTLLTKAIRQIHQFVTFSVHAPTQYALADYIRDPEVYEKLPDFYQQKRDFLIRQLKGTNLNVRSSAGTYYLLCNYENLSNLSEQEFCRHLIREAGVASIPISSFYKNGHDEKVIRLCFAKKEATLLAAGQSLRRYAEAKRTV